MTLGPAHGGLHPAQADLCPAHAELHPARTNLHPARAENQPEVTSGALFHGYFHVLRGVQSVSSSLDKVPRRATISESAVSHKTQWFYKQSPTNGQKHAP